MWKQKLGMSVGPAFGAPETVIPLVADSGFDAVSPEWVEDGGIEACAAAAKAAGLTLQSVHAPFGLMNRVWEQDPEAAKAPVEQLLHCLEDCAGWEVPVMVAHAFIGFRDHTPTRVGLDRMETVVHRAEALGVRIAFENTEGEEYLDALMDAFRDRRAVGYCWDSGHELCYNRSRDLLGDYGDRLAMTHLNDNLGISDFGGEITWLDDLHLLPFDGITDWDEAARRLSRCAEQEILNFELTRLSKPGRHDNDGYGRLSLPEYLAECRKRACRVAEKVRRAKSLPRL